MIVTGVELSTKTFNKNVFNFLSKNLNFVPMQKYFNKKKFYNETNGFQLGNKLKAYFKDPTNKQKQKLFLENRLIKCGLLKKTPYYCDIYRSYK